MRGGVGLPLSKCKDNFRSLAQLLHPRCPPQISLVSAPVFVVRQRGLGLTQATLGTRVQET